MMYSFHYYVDLASWGRGAWPLAPSLNPPLVVDACQYKSANKSLTIIDVQYATELAKPSEMKEACRYHFGDVFTHAQRAVKQDTTVANTISQFYVRLSKMDCGVHRL